MKTTTKLYFCVRLGDQYNLQFSLESSILFYFFGALYKSIHTPKYHPILLYHPKKLLY